MNYLCMIVLLAFPLIVGCDCDETEPSPHVDAGPDGCANSDGGPSCTGMDCIPMTCNGANTPVETCDLSAAIASCEWCKANGCQMSTMEPDQCEGGVIHYTDMLGCLQAPGPQANCPACAGITFGMPITAACETCAKPFTPCSLNCTTEASGGNK